MTMPAKALTVNCAMMSWISRICCVSWRILGAMGWATVEAARYLENWQHEVDSGAEYRAIASGEPDPKWESVTTAGTLAQREAILRRAT
jgi:hypothetical protein